MNSGKKINEEDLNNKLDSLLAQIPKRPATYDIKLKGDKFYENVTVLNM